MCVRKKKQVDLLTLILPFHIDYISRLFLSLTVVAQQQIFYRCIYFNVVLLLKNISVDRIKKTSSVYDCTVEDVEYICNSNSTLCLFYFAIFVVLLLS